MDKSIKTDDLGKRPNSIKRAGPADRTLLEVGLVGTAVAALCCFTPLLGVLLGAVGLAALVGWLDMVLLPALALFAGITLFALLRRWPRWRQPA